MLLAPALVLLAWTGEPVRWEYLADAPAAEACPSGDELRQRVLARLGVDPFGATGLRAIRIDLHRSGPRFEAVVQLTEGSRATARRVLTSEGLDCRELAESVALAVTVALDPILHTEDPTEPAAPPPPAVSSPPLADPVVTATIAAASPALRLRVWAGPSALLGASQSMAFGARIGGELWLGTAALGIELEADGMPSTLQVVGNARVEHSAIVFLGSVLGCLGLSVFDACLVASAGALEISGPRVDAGVRRAAVLLAGARGRVALLRGSFGVRLELGLAAHLLPYSLRVDETVAYRSPPLLGNAGIVLVWAP